MADPVSVAVIQLIAEKIIDALVGKVVDESISAGHRKLKEDSPKQVFKQALGEAIHRYSTYGSRMSIAEPLLSNKSPLSQQDVAKELAQVLKFDRPPNYQLIGDRWEAAIENPPQWRDFIFEAELLTRFLVEELQATEVFGPVFDSKNLSALNTNIAISKETLADIDENIKSLANLMNSRFGKLIKAFSVAGYNINSQIRDFSWYIEEKTQSFVGRRFVYESIDKFCLGNPSGYFFVKGDPGIGKTSLVAQYVRQTGCIHHFNNRSLGINRSEMFLKNICSQLIAYCHLNYSSLHQEATQDSHFLISLMNQASEKLKANEKIIIVIDGLDEVDISDSSRGINLLYLPMALPKGFYVIATSRNTDLGLRIESEQHTMLINQAGEENLKDIREFIVEKLHQQEMQDFISSQALSEDQFVSFMVQKSQGNFMYLKYVLTGIERGTYVDVNLETLPEGLIGYYEDHWRRMRTQSENEWFEYKLPIVIALSLVKEPISLDLISDFSSVKDLRRIRSVLHEWQQFLYIQTIETDTGKQKRWRVYHDSFREFIANKDEVEGEHVDLKKAHKIITDSLWNDLCGPHEN